MELTVRIARTQLVALEACAEGLELFDRLAPSGVFITSDPEEVRRAAQAVRRESSDFAEWLGPLCVEGSGYGDGDGYGDGYGDGSGYGDGYGYGSGYGDGYGYGSGYGDGYGYGYGYGYGSGYGYGYGYGYGDGYGYGA